MLNGIRFTVYCISMGQREITELNGFGENIVKFFFRTFRKQTRSFDNCGTGKERCIYFSKTDILALCYTVANSGPAGVRTPAGGPFNIASFTL